MDHLTVQKQNLLFRGRAEFGDWQLGKLMGAWRTFDLLATETLTSHYTSAKFEASVT